MDLASGQLAALSHSEASGVQDCFAEQPRDFSFAVTWSTLIANLEPIQVADPAFMRVEAPLSVATFAPAGVPALVSVEHPIPTRVPERESGARWEMVVPKMVRATARGSVAPRSVPSPRTKPRFLFTHEHDEHAYPPEKPWLSRTLSAISGRTKSLLPGAPENLQLLRLNPAKPVASGVDRIATEEEIAEQRARRELILSRIANAVRGRSKNAEVTLSIHRHGKEAGIP